MNEEQPQPTGGGTVVNQQSSTTIPNRPRAFHHPHFWICLILTAGEFWLFYSIFYTSIPEANQRIADMMFGSYGTAWLGSIGYWFQTTFGSNNKTDLLARAGAVDPQ